MSNLLHQQKEENMVSSFPAKKRKNIALFMAMLENEFSAAILEGASIGANEIDANLFVFPVGLIDGAYSDKVGNVFRYQYNVLSSFLRSNSLDGAVIEYGTIVSTIPEERKPEFLSEIGDVPVVLLAESAKGYPSICVDNKVGLEEVINHLIHKHKCSKIGFVSGPSNNHDAQERLKVYQDTLKSNNINLSNDWIAYGNFSVYSGDAVTELVTKHPDIEAIVFANDHMALGAYPVLEKLGKIPGKDILVTGFDNIPSAILATPPLTTVIADTKQLAYKAILELNKETALPDMMYVNSQMVTRKSCSCEDCDLINKLVNPYSNNCTENESSDIYRLQNITREKILEGEKRKEFETELGNILREMVFYHDSRRDWYSLVLDVLKKLDFNSTYLLQYDKCIYHRNGTVWTQPDSANLMAYFTNTEKKLYDFKSKILNIDNLFNYDLFEKDHRFEMLVTPLFFRENQYGFMMVESNNKYFQYAFHIASQISSTLEIMNIMDKQEKARLELELSSKSKTNFLTNITTELRTPTNVILGMNEMIIRENTIPEIDEYAVDIKVAANSILKLTNDILDYAKLESNKMTLIHKEYSLYDMLDSLVKYVHPKTQEKGLYFILECANDLPSKYVGDEKRLFQVLNILFLNAIKNTTTGGIKLGISGRRENNNEFLTFEIRDTGPGISKEKITVLTNTDKKAESFINNQSEGLGLGLNISNGLLTLMGSKLEIKSENNEGTVFYFTVCQSISDDSLLPSLNVCNFINNADSNQKKYEQLYIAPTASILVVDDNDLNRSIIKNLLKHSEILIHEAQSGDECLDMFSKYDYDLILMDDVMPNLSGAKTFELLKNLNKFKKNPIPVIIVSSKMLYDDVLPEVKKGFNGSLAKPINPLHLDEIMLEFLPNDKLIYSESFHEEIKKRRTQTEKNNTRIDNPAPTQKETIMLVDSNNTALEIEQRIFIEKYNIITVQTARKCIDYLNNSEDMPDIIIVDTDLSDINAFSLLSQILGNTKTSDIPVILMTSDNNRNIEIKCFEAGASDFFIKPLIPEIVQKRVRRLLDLNHLQKHLEDEVSRQTRASEEERLKVKRLSLQSMTALAASIDAKDKYTNGHSIRVAKYSKMIAAKAGKSINETEEIYYIGLLHDVGKIGVPDEIINKPSKLTDKEYAVIKTHPLIGADILKNIDVIPNIAIGAKWHHERFDGKGYPDGLSKEKIPEIARIIGVADAYDAMTSVRSYRGILSQETVRAEIEKGRGTQFDPVFANIMLEIIDEDVNYKLHE